jgi:hypothetical protein
VTAARIVEELRAKAAAGGFRAIAPFTGISALLAARRSVSDHPGLNQPQGSTILIA